MINKKNESDFYINQCKKKAKEKKEEELQSCRPRSAHDLFPVYIATGQMFAYLHFCYFRWIHLFKLWVTANNQTFFKKTRKRHRNQCSITREADPSRINGEFTNRVAKQTSAQYQNDNKVHLPFVQSQSLGHNILTNCNETTRATCPLFSFSPLLKPDYFWV
jgi:hypothetical protein